jgi:hypothetical protein
VPDQQLPTGVYRHYSGKHYLVIGVARDDSYEGDERLLVIYSRLYNRDGVPLCARPLSEFCEVVDTDDGPIPRFTPMGYADSVDDDDNTEREEPVTRKAK